MIRSDTTGCVIKRGIALFFVSCALISALLSFSYAWFYSGTTYHFFNGHVILGYFDPTSGNGKSPDSPYIISEPKHFYNFVWLQNVGAFDEKTYLKIKDGVE